MAPAHKKYKAGFTMLEIMAAMIFFAVAVPYLLDAYNKGMYANLYLDRAAIAINFAQERIEQIKRMSYPNIATMPLETFTWPSPGSSVSWRRTTTVSTTAANPNTTYKTVTVTVAWLMKTRLGAPSYTEHTYSLVTYIADY